MLVWIFLYFWGLKRYPQHWVCCPLLLRLFLRATARCEHRSLRSGTSLQEQSWWQRGQVKASGWTSARWRHAHNIVQAGTNSWSLNISPRLMGRCRFLIALFPTSDSQVPIGTMTKANFEHRQPNPMRNEGKKLWGVTVPHLVFWHSLFWNT